MKNQLANYLGISVISSLLFFSCGKNAGEEQTEDSPSGTPNILMIMSDDHAYQAISAYDRPIDLNQTPNLDRIANEGALFRKAFVANSICAPSRATILTGKFTHLNGLTDNGKVFDGNQLTFPVLLQEKGYQTAMIGKWHLKSDPVGFDFWAVHYDQGDYYNPDLNIMGDKTRIEGYSTKIVTDMTMNWIDKRDTTKPFAALMYYKAPHRNWFPDISKLDMYEDTEFPVPANFFDNYEGRTAAEEQDMSVSETMMMAWDMKLRGMEGLTQGLENKLDRMNEEQRSAFVSHYKAIQDEFDSLNLEGKELALWKYQRYMRDYLSVISSVDDNVGRMLDYLEEKGLAENTLVIYTSDQGFYLGEHGWFDKRFMYEESFRTPLMVKLPGKVKPGTVIDGLVQNIDYGPTILDYAGLEIPDEMQGLSMKPLLEGTSPAIRDAVYYQYFEYPGIHEVKRHYGIRTDRYKLIHYYYDIDQWELFDLEKDPSEMNNLINDPEFAPLIDQLKQQLNDLRIQYQSSDSLYNTILDADMEARRKWEEKNK